ncbi:MAG: alpha/beta hydrolase [Actinomycetota bacterium]|nr:alpha/beta hydrolase [Actinomycetota bacterium]
MELTLKLPGGRIHGYRWGDPRAPLVICVHGLSANHTAFAWLAEGLVRAGYGVLAYDCRGRGRSEVTPAGSYGLTAHARDVRELADHVGVERFHLVGWSTGAGIGMVAAGQLGTRLRSLVLLDHAGPVDPRAGELVRAGLASLDAVVDAPEEYLEAIRTRGLIDPWTPFWALVRTSVSLGGGPDRAAGSPGRAGRSCPWVTVVEVGTNHWTVMTDPAMLAATLDTLGAGEG